MAVIKETLQPLKDLPGDTRAGQPGTIIFIAAFGMMCSLVAVDLADLNSWYEATNIKFVGGLIGHLGTVIAAYVGGRLTRKT